MNFKLSAPLSVKSAKNGLIFVAAVQVIMGVIWIGLAIYCAHIERILPDGKLVSSDSSLNMIESMHGLLRGMFLDVAPAFGVASVACAAIVIWALRTLWRVG